MSKLRLWFTTIGLRREMSHHYLIGLRKAKAEMDEMSQDKRDWQWQKISYALEQVIQKQTVQE